MSDPLREAVLAGDLAAVRHRIAAGDPIDGGDPRDGQGTPLWDACARLHDAETRLAIATLLLEHGADARASHAGDTILHLAAARGPLALVEAVIRHGAITFAPNGAGESVIDVARRGDAAERAAIVELLVRPVIRDPSFRRAVDAIHRGDLDALVTLLDAEPRLLRERIVEPQCYRDATRPDYFLDPYLFWFVGWNPPLAPTVPSNLAAIARGMIDRGVSKANLDYALMLAMSSGVVRRQGQLRALMDVLLDAGAEASAHDVMVALAHRELEPVHLLVERGLAMTPAIAAAFGDAAALRHLLPMASLDEARDALAMATINHELGCARLALEAGADPNAFMPIHSHSLPVHQAAGDGNLPMLELLVAHGARTDIADTLWHGTPLGWAQHGGREDTAAFLAKREAT